jgi:hypothetical protein
MFNTGVPYFPAYMDNDDHHLSTIRLPAFAGMQITNGPYGILSEQGLLSGETFAVADKSIDPEEYRVVIAWVVDHDSDIRAILFPALVEQYWQMRDLFIESEGDEDPGELLPEIQHPDQLARLCSLFGLHVGGMAANGEPRFGIELACNWEEEHGAGVRFQGLKVVDVGEASNAYLFPKEE